MKQDLTRREQEYSGAEKGNRTMILIVGGHGQGHTEYAKQCLNDLSESKEDGFRIADGIIQISRKWRLEQI
ncbi:MAG: hypothetical protein V8S27_05110 [Lachnospiraceae bacterium]